MTTFRLFIECHNDAFRLPSDNAEPEQHAEQAKREVQRILEWLATNEVERADSGYLRDVNGNTVGHWKFE